MLLSPAEKSVYNRGWLFVFLCNLSHANPSNILDAQQNMNWKQYICENVERTLH